MKYVIAMDAILYGHLPSTTNEGIFFWCGNDGWCQLTRNVAVAEQYDTRKEAEKAIKLENVASNVDFAKQIRGDIFVLELEEKELFKLTLKDPRVDIGLD